MYRARRADGEIALLACGMVAAVFCAYLASHGKTVYIAALIAVPVGVARPHLLAYVAVGVLGSAPFTAFTYGAGGYNIPVLCVMSALVLVVMTCRRLIEHTADLRRLPIPPILALCATALLLLGAVSFLFTRGVDGSADTTEFGKWLSLASFALVPALLGRAWTLKAVRVFGFAVAVAAVFAVAAYFASSLTTLLSHLGYSEGGTSGVRYFVSAGGQEVSVRAAGSFTDPNIAGTFFLLGILAVMNEPRPRFRFAALGALGVALVLTLSREAYFAAALSALLLAFGPSVSGGRRLGIAVALGVGLIAILIIPATHDRLLGTFSSNDVGSTARLSAFSQFTSVMKGHWSVGLGWGRPEFRNSTVAYTTNIVSNAPLASIYRGGIVAGLGFAVWYLFSLFSGLIGAASRSDEVRSFAAGAVALCLIGMLGYATALTSQVVCVFSFWVGALAVLSYSAPS